MTSCSERFWIGTVILTVQSRRNINVSGYCSYFEYQMKLVKLNSQESVGVKIEPVL